MMPFEEYEEEVKSILKNEYDFDDEYIGKLDIRKSYNDGVELIKKFGYTHLDPHGYCYAISMIYPDLP